MMVRATLLAAALGGVASVILPGSIPKDYANGDQIPLLVNKIWSAKTQLPYSYYSLPFCRPEKVETERENIGQVLVGDRIQSSDYKLLFGQDSQCNVLCAKTYQEGEVKAFTERIEQEYTVNWIMDSLPAAVRMFDEEAPENMHYERGFPLGFSARPGGADKDLRFYLFNHVQFVISYHQEDGKASADAAAASDARFRIVGFEVEPFTVKHAKADPGKAEWAGNLKTCTPTRPCPARRTSPKRWTRPAPRWCSRTTWCGASPMKCPGRGAGTCTCSPPTTTTSTCFPS